MAEDRNKEKMRALEAAMKKIEKDFGQGSIMVLGEEDSNRAIEVIPSGSIAMDVALGVGGYPRGRIIEIYGPESSGKTTLTLHAIAQAQKLGGMTAFVDAEHALDPLYARNLGVDLKRLLISQPDSGEEALEIVETLVRSGAVDLIVVDSVAALVPKAEIEGNMGDMQMGLQARLMSQALRKLAGVVHKSKTAVIFTNQLRMKIGISFGNPETTTGGMAMKFYASVRVDVRRTSTIKDATESIGSETRVKIVKNKVASPFREAIFDVIYGKGIVRENELVNMGVLLEFVLKKGSWFSYLDPSGQEISMGQGKNAAVDFLKQNPDISDELERRIREKSNIPGTSGMEKQPLADPEDIDTNGTNQTDD